MCFSLLAFSDFNDSFIPQLRMTLFFLFGFLTQNFRDQMIVSSNRYYSLVPSVPHLVCWVVWGFLVGWLVDFFVGFWVGWLGFFFLKYPHKHLWIFHSCTLFTCTFLSYHILLPRLFYQGKTISVSPQRYSASSLYTSLLLQEEFELRLQRPHLS